MIYTSRFSNPTLKSGEYTVVGIVRGLPRFKLGYERAGNIIEIAPPRELFNIYDREKFTAPYKRHLDKVGLERISELLQSYSALGKDVVLCCYEDVRKQGEWCHRLVFAEWWLEKTGELIEELHDNSPIKSKIHKPTEELTADKPLILVQYSVWRPRAHLPYQGGDVFYSVDKATGKLTRLFDKAARELISSGKVDVVFDFDSVEKLRFVLQENSAVKVYRVNKKGDAKEIDFKEAVEMAASGMFNILDVVTE